MRRREFITLAGGAALSPVLGPRTARAQPSSGRPLIGILVPLPATAWTPNLEALRAGLRELGYVESHNIWLEVRYADGAPARLPALAAELVARKPDVIVAASAPSTLAVHSATRTIPVVMTTTPDPVALGVVKRIARPGAMSLESGRSADMTR
jgi:putative ABC transport system substrate-binding protein